MRTPLIASFVLGMAVITVNVQAVADEHDNRQEDRQENRQDNRQDNHQYVRHEEWKKGAKMRDEDWQRGEHIDYRDRHLRSPPRGYEWRQVDGNYVLAALATGVIVSVVAASVAAH
jgi:Ni/Co efflux regulator RcnB